jgi:LmbE family N-acetylglucosaminyl deacetylase
LKNFASFFDAKKLDILCLGAHADDIEIGCGGTILRLIKKVPEVNCYWIVFSGDKKRTNEAYQSANLFLKGAKSTIITIKDYKESYFPFVGYQIKTFFDEIGKKNSPDLIFTHYLNDAHQDHRLISKLTWNTFRDHFILEYEILKYDGDFGNPNLYICLNEIIVNNKLKMIYGFFESQKEKKWFNKDTFKSILRIRGVESNSPSQYAEAFYCRKMVY